MTALNSNVNQNTHKIAKAKTAATKKSADAKTAAEQAEAKRSSAKQADVVLHRIRDEQKKLARNESDVVRALIAIGAQLVLLQEATKATRDWTKQVETVGYHPRVARRLLEIGKSWWGQNGPPGPELLERLPNDLQKLVAICRLPSDRLPGFLDGINCKEEGRQRVIDAVKSELGEGKKPKARPIQPDKVVASFEKAAIKTVAALKGAVGEIADDMRDRLRKALDQALDDPTATTDPAMPAAVDAPRAMPRRKASDARDDGTESVVVDQGS